MLLELLYQPLCHCLHVKIFWSFHRSSNPFLFNQLVSWFFGKHFLHFFTKRFLGRHDRGGEDRWHYIHRTDVQYAHSFPLKGIMGAQDLRQRSWFGDAKVWIPHLPQAEDQRFEKPLGILECCFPNEYQSIFKPYQTKTLDWNSQFFDICLGSENRGLHQKQCCRTIWPRSMAQIGDSSFAAGTALWFTTWAKEKISGVWSLAPLGPCVTFFESRMAESVEDYECSRSFGQWFVVF